MLMLGKICRFLWEVGGAQAARAAAQRAPSFELAMSHQARFSWLLRRLALRHTNKLLILAAYAVALHRASVTGAAVLAVTLLCTSYLGRPQWQQRQRLQSVAAASAGVLAAAWMLALYAVSWAPIAQRLPAAVLPRLQLYGIAPAQVWC